MPASDILRDRSDHVSYRDMMGRDTTALMLYGPISVEVTNFSTSSISMNFVEMNAPSSWTLGAWVQCNNIDIYWSVQCHI